MKSEMSSPQNTTVSSKSPITTEISELEHLRKLFVGGLHIFTTEQTMSTFYSQFGTVESVIIMRDQLKKSRCFGFVTFTKANMVDEAQKNRPHVIDGKQVESKRSLPRSQLNNPDANVSVRKVFVGGLKDNHDEECLKEHFSQFGNVIGVQIIVDKATGRKRGFGYVEFDDYDAVDKAVFTQPHTLKYVVVDVKKSIYKKQQDQQNFPSNDPVHNQPAPTQNWGPNCYSQPPPNWGGNYTQPPPNWNWGPYWGWNQQNWGPPPNSGWSWNPQSGWVQTPQQQSSQNNSEQKGSSDAQESQSSFNNTSNNNFQGSQTSYPPGGPPASYPPGGPPPFSAFAGIPPTNYQQPQNSYTSNAGPPASQPNSGNQQSGWGSGYSQNWSAGPMKSNQNSSNRNNPYSASKSFKNDQSSSRSNQTRQF